MTRETLETHVFSCAVCETAFESRDRNQLARSRKGMNVFCGEGCRDINEARMQRIRPGIHKCGPCPTCGIEFNSKTKGKRFCSIECYTSSEEMLSRLAEHNANKAKDWKCHHCGNDAPRKRKFCNDFCRRRFFSERFDRFIANPETIALPQNFDEFLNRDELPCLIEGCDWVGSGLSYHINFHHGIDPDKFREMVGFNATTALMGVAAREKRSEIMRGLIEKGIIIPGSYPLKDCQRGGKPLRLEGREHWKKSMAMGGMDKLIKAGIASSQSEEGRRRSSEIAKRTAEQMPKVTLVCHECGKEYETPKNQEKRSKFCGLKCRNASSRKRRNSST